MLFETTKLQSMGIPQGTSKYAARTVNQITSKLDPHDVTSQSLYFNRIYMFTKVDMRAHMCIVVDYSVRFRPASKTLLAAIVAASE